VNAAAADENGGKLGFAPIGYIRGPYGKLAHMPNAL